VWQQDAEKATVVAESKERESEEGGGLPEEEGKRDLPAAATAASSAKPSAAPAPAVADKAPGQMEEGLGEKRTESMVSKVFYQTPFIV